MDPNYLKIIGCYRHGFLPVPVSIAFSPHSLIYTSNLHLLSYLHLEMAVLFTDT